MAEIVNTIEEIPVRLVGQSRILILGGIREAADLAAMLVGQEHSVTTSLAGRTNEPVPVCGKVRVGGFGGVAGLAAYLEDQAIDVLVDATHPFAKQISTNAVLAAEIAQCQLIVFHRAPWQKQIGDKWIEVASLAAACEAIPQNATVLLALGSQYISVFQKRSDVHFLVRMVDAPTQEIPLEKHTIVLGRPGDVVAETLLLKKQNISHIVCRNSGGVGAYAKIEAARQLHLPVIIINR